MTEKPEWEKIDDILAKPDSEITDDERRYLAESVGWDYDRQRSYDDIDEDDQDSPSTFKVVDQFQDQFDTESNSETVRVFRIKMVNEDLPELILNSLDDLNVELEYTFFGENEMWRDYADGTTLTITIDTMLKSEFDALEEWEA